MQKNSDKTSDRTKIPRMQLFRMARIVALLKKNRLPTAQSLLKEYEKLEFEANQLIRAKYNIRTVYRDIASLKFDFNCPIAYDRLSKGYYLTDRNWEFNAPAQLSESAMLALIIGARLAEELFPDPLRSRIANAVDEILKCANPDFLETALIHSLKVFAEAGTTTDPEIFQKVFEAWQKHQKLKIIYDDKRSQTPSERIVEPHALFWYLRQWRIKAYCHLRKSFRTFVIDRILSAELVEEYFKPDMQVINSISQDNIVSYRKLENVQIKLQSDAIKFALSTRIHSRQELKMLPGNTAIFQIPQVAEEVIVPWILSQQGDATPLAPEELKQAVKSKINKLQKSL